MDKLIWSKIKSGDKQAFRLLFDEHYSSLCLYANSLVNNLELSQDIVSDCFVRIWERKNDIGIESSIKHYLLFSVRNAIYSYLRSPESRKTDINTIIDKLENTPIEEYNLETDESILRVYKLIEELPEQRRKILELATFKGKSYKEISEVLGISVNTVNTQMTRAYRFLRDRLTTNDFLLWLFFQKN
ncbi:RNA polymerase sigma-70 factor [Mariniphaga sediminis]|uniref:RNA polymerase sigma-70 factor n=1 Tax=Mariniphaga sediminis TaxID=1628158 RepID=A0A399D088_9BACT|nr:RNA polymerase sigma-70 factor [Mariniphaga sediminis]RIH65425.1 RNA polymerase sigma-70 factor [Mariniphaga sediminis]